MNNHLDEFFQYLEDVGMSAVFQAHAPEHMIGKPIALRTSEDPSKMGLASAKRGKHSDDEWNSAYKRVVSKNYLKENRIRVQDINKVFQWSKNLLTQKGIAAVAMEESNQPPDVHGLPDGYLSYGRGWVDPRGGLVIKGGMTGSSQGHDSSAKNGFYWGITAHPKGQRYLVLKGRAGETPEKWIAFFSNNFEVIVRMLYKEHCFPG